MPLSRVEPRKYIRLCLLNDRQRLFCIQRFSEANRIYTFENHDLSRNVSSTNKTSLLLKKIEAFKGGGWMCESFLVC